VKELAPNLPMRLNECNARNDYDLGMSGGHLNLGQFLVKDL
jgi:hypothetical protein